jgi:ABC-type antimicrobial peptide transport system permease subunit
LTSIPGVEAVTTSGMPILSSSIQAGLPRLSDEEKVEAPEAVTILTSTPPDYFRVMGLRLRAGRFFAPGEKNLAIVNESFAKSRGNDVIGKRVHTPMSKESYEIVGVVNDTKAFGLADLDVRFNIYMPTEDHTDAFARYIVRTAGDPVDVINAARIRVAELDRALPLLATQTGLDVVRRQTAQHRFIAALTGGLAVLGFVLALASVYGAVALSLSRRTREIGIRLALGATRGSLARLLTAAGLRPVLAGGALGIGAAWLATPYLDALLFQVPARDPVSAAMAIALVVSAAGLAAVVPARRASRVDPVITLRAE